VGKSTRTIVIVGLLLVIAGGAIWKFRKNRVGTGVVRISYRASEFAVHDLKGQPVGSKTLRGKVVLVDFWATWCVPCESEIPHLAEWQKKYDAQGLQVVGLSMDDTVSPVKTYVEKHKMEYPVAMADEKTIAAFGGVLGLPVNIVIGRDGKQIAKHVGVTDINVLEQEVQRALAEK
jgi:thiol-disulfide isomerase/thioredoxin